MRLVRYKFDITIIRIIRIIIVRMRSLQIFALIIIMAGLGVCSQVHELVNKLFELCGEDGRQRISLYECE